MTRSIKELETVSLAAIERTNQSIIKSEEKITLRLDEMNDKFNELTTKVNNVEKKHDKLQEKHDTLEDTVKNMQIQIKELKEYKAQQIKDAKASENRAVMAEYHSKKYNSILYNWPETKAWENPDDSRKELNKFSKTF